jgi:hypothetical protein
MQRQLCERTDGLSERRKCIDIDSVPDADFGALLVKHNASILWTQHLDYLFVEYDSANNLFVCGIEGYRKRNRIG